MTFTLDELIREVKTRHPEGTALEHLSEAAEIAQYLDELADHLVGHFVDQARRGGASWTMIGQSMGVTKQAAQKRFVAGDASLDRFTNRARIVVLKAETEARARGHAEVSSLHLLLGLTHEWEGLAGQALEAFGVKKKAFVAAVTAALPGNGDPGIGHVPFSSGLKKVHELIVREALRLGHNYIGTEHILLGVLEANDGEGARLLTGFGVTKPDVEKWTLHTLAKMS